MAGNNTLQDVVFGGITLEGIARIRTELAETGVAGQQPDMDLYE